jgi:hypothetical protein
MIATIALYFALMTPCPPLGCVVSPNPPMTVPYIYLPQVTK